ncbi:unnamed protein product [Rotaria socialis]|uniref:Uncharacterized protein n=1 Tax=Rotaria socialis TaxID=392032 RepID=A0A818CHA8_9BILA|nr:unnamed protein product [Rotaria socialis]CAF4409076.1 unnamed protein product [Rotaria socialis]
MTRDEREALSQRICHFYLDSSNRSVKTTVNYFTKQNIPPRTIYYVLNKYFKYGTTKDRRRTGRPLKLTTEHIQNLVKSVNNRCGLSQRKMARRFQVHQSTISRNLRRRTAIVIRKRRKAPKMDNKEQENRARKNCGKLYRQLLNGCDLILDDEKYFKLSGNNVCGNRYFYSTDPSSAPPNIKFQGKKKFEPKVMIWMACSSKGISDIYVHRSKQAIDQHTYLKECINKRLLAFIERYHNDGNYLFWPDLANAHYAKVVQTRLNEKNVLYVRRQDNPPNVPQARPIEYIWAQLERKIYENNWEAKNVNTLIRRIRQKVKELNRIALQTMIRGTPMKHRAMWRNGLYSVC